jgi:hypothetical protein
LKEKFYRSGLEIGVKIGGSSTVLPSVLGEHSATSRPIQIKLALGD